MFRVLRRSACDTSPQDGRRGHGRPRPGHLVGPGWPNFEFAKKLTEATNPRPNARNQWSDKGTRIRDEAGNRPALSSKMQPLALPVPFATMARCRARCINRPGPRLQPLPRHDFTSRPCQRRPYKKRWKLLVSQLRLLFLNPNRYLECGSCSVSLIKLV